MSTKTAVMIGLIVGSTIGGYIPTLWGAGLLSYSSLAGSTIGGLVGIFAAYRLVNN